MPLVNPSFIAGGTILPSRFVNIDPTSNFQVVQVATAKTVKIIGVSQDGTYTPPGVLGSTGNAAVAGQQITVFGPGEVCLLQCSGTPTAGDWLQSDATGQGVTTAFTSGVGNLFVGAIALETSTAAGNLIRVLVFLAGLTAITA